MKDYEEIERKRYGKMAAMIVNGMSPEELAATNMYAKLSLGSVKELIETAGDSEDLAISIMASISRVVASILITPFRDSAADARRVFNSYTLAVASMLGVYDLTATADTEEGKKLAAMLEEVDAELNERHAKDEEADKYASEHTGLYL